MRHDIFYRFALADANALLFPLRTSQWSKLVAAGDGRRDCRRRSSFVLINQARLADDEMDCSKVSPSWARTLPRWVTPALHSFARMHRFVDNTSRRCQSRWGQFERGEAVDIGRAEPAMSRSTASIGIVISQVDAGFTWPECRSEHGRGAIYGLLQCGQHYSMSQQSA